MGFGGINCHLVLEGHRVLEGVSQLRRRGYTATERRWSTSAQETELLLIAAPDEGAFHRRLDRLRERAPWLSSAELGDLAASLGSSVAEEPSLASGGPRAAVQASSPDQLAERLDDFRHLSIEAFIERYGER